jgi:hypothetical protein
MKRIIAFQILAIALLTSCEKKSLPDIQEGTPSFVSLVNFDGQDYGFTAGENEITLTPLLSLNSASAVFNSAFTNLSCPGCGPELRIIIHSPDSVNPSAVTDWAAELGSWQYEMEDLGTSAATTQLNLAVSSGNNFSQGIWSLNNEVLNGGIPSNSVSFAVEVGSFALAFDNVDGLCANGGDLDLTFNGESIPCYGSMTIDPDTMNLFTAFPGAGFNLAATTYTWFVDNVAINTGQNPSLFVTVLPDSGSVCVSMDDATGCSVLACAAVPDSLANCVTNLRITDSFLSDSANFNPSLGAFVEIQFRDVQGNLFTSRHPDQENALIELLSIQSYNEPTMGTAPFAATTFEVACSLYDPSGNAFPFSGVINTALALPE